MVAFLWVSLEYDTYFLPDNLAVSVNWGLVCGCPWNTIPTFYLIIRLFL